MDKKKVLKYIGITYLFAWTIQIIVSLYALKHETLTGQTVFKTGLIIVMFVPLIAALITNGSLKGMGWKPKFKGNIKWIIFAAFVPTILTILGFVCFFAIFPGLFGLDGGYMIKMMEESGLDPDKVSEALEAAGLNMKTLMLISIIQCIFEAPLVNMFAAIGEEAGWRGFLYPELIKGFGRVKAWLIGGAVWAAFHFPCMLIAGYEYGLNYIGAPVFGMVVFTIICIALGIMCEIIYDKTKCIWYPAMFHGAINGAATLYQFVININEIDKVEKLMVFGPCPNGLIAGIPLIITAIIMAVLVIRKKEKNI